MSTEDAETAAGMEFEQAQEAIQSLPVSDDIYAKIQDAQLNPTLQKLAKLFIKLYKEVASLIHTRKDAEPWETVVAAMMQVLAMCFPKQFGFDASRLQHPVKKKEDAPNGEPDAIKAFDNNYAHLLTPEVINLLFTVWDIWNASIQYAWAKGSIAFTKNGYGNPRGTPWIEFIGIAAVMAKQHQNMIKFRESEPGKTYKKKLILQHVSKLRCWLRSKLDQSGFRREQSHWKHCYDIVELKVANEKGEVVIGKSKFMDDTWNWPPEPELEIDLEGDTESEDEGEGMGTDVTMGGTEEEEEEEEEGEGEGKLEDESEESVDPRLRGFVTESLGYKITLADFHSAASPSRINRGFEAAPEEHVERPPIVPDGILTEWGQDGGGNWIVVYIDRSRRIN